MDGNSEGDASLHRLTRQEEHRMAEALNSLNDLFIMELKDILDAEVQITEALPKMADAASSPTPKSQFKQHLQQTEGQIQRLNQVFAKLNLKPEREHCDGMEGLIKDGSKALKAPGDPNAKDAALIAAAQKVEHYEISSYGTLRTFAKTLGLNDVADLLQQTLKEESYTDDLLSQTAMRSVNKKAA